MNIRFSQIDSWFFREARPYDTIGGIELSSVFPPAARTIGGAVRSLMGERAGLDWRYPSRDTDVQASVRARIGGAADFGSLRMRGPYLERGGERLFTVPLSLLRLKNGKSWRRLGIGPAMRCDLGNVRLPILQVGDGGASAPSGWLTSRGFDEFLCGEVPSSESFLATRSLTTDDSRLGIARINSRRTVEEHMLYQTSHVRLSGDVDVVVEIDGLEPDDLPPGGAYVPFGGDGRLARLEISDTPSAPSPRPAGGESGLILVLVTHAALEHTNDGPVPLPSRFVPQTRTDGRNVWMGEINGVDLEIESAVIGKPVREGGWDIANRCPRPVRSLIPAGSAWYCRVSGDANEAARRLHGQQVGTETEIGRGEIAVGVWPTTEDLT